jgi:hypothetical protein
LWPNCASGDVMTGFAAPRLWALAAVEAVEAQTSRSRRDLRLRIEVTGGG